MLGKTQLGPRTGQGSLALGKQLHFFDDYDWGKIGKSPEGAVSLPKERKRQSLIPVRDVPDIPNAPMVPMAPDATGAAEAAEQEDPRQTLEEPKPKIHKRTLMHWREGVPNVDLDERQHDSTLAGANQSATESSAPNLPDTEHKARKSLLSNLWKQSPEADVEKATHGTTIRQRFGKKPQVTQAGRIGGEKTNDTAQPPVVDGSVIRDSGRSKQLTHALTDTKQTGPQACSHSTKDIMLHWKSISTDEEKEYKLNITECQTDVLRNDRLLWHHCENPQPSIEELKNLVTHCKLHGLSEDEIGLTRRLLKRVQVNSERPFIRGHFLLPYAHRYDGLHLLKDEADQACTFFNFPYIALSPKLPKRKTTKEDHPTRALLQSRYRLNKTKERDKNQAPMKIDRKSLKSFIELPTKGNDPPPNETSSPPNKTGPPPSKRIDEVVYVPQIWCLIVGSSTMITNGPISDICLVGTALKLEPARNILSIIMISFEYQNRPERFVYSTHQCNSWFGLLNKQKQILQDLGIDKNGSKARDYKLFLDETQVDSQNWVPILQASKNIETLELSLKNIKIPGIDEPREGKSSAGRPRTKPGAAAKGKMPITGTEALPVTSDGTTILTFLEWPILDQFGEPHEDSLDRTVNKFLILVWRSLPGDSIADRVVPQGQQKGLHPSSQISSSQQLAKDIRIQRVAFSQVRDNVGALTSIESSEDFEVRQDILEKFKTLLGLFVPERMHASSETVQVYWGAINLLIVGGSGIFPLPLSALKELNTSLSTVLDDAVHLHRGVKWFDVSPPGKCYPHTDIPITQNIVLLAVIFDALKAIFHLLVDAVRHLPQGKEQDSNTMTEFYPNLLKSVGETCTLLRTARDQLITEAGGQGHYEGVGPVVTPETVMIILMERLMKGVYKDGNVNIIALYEKCLQRLAEEVEHRASRRLLKQINGLSEEVDVIYDILKQQKKVLADYHELLDPKSFDIPTLDRKSRFVHESKMIEKLKEIINEQMGYCTELKDRALRLVELNLQLVDALQDDGSKAILIFTVVTVFFLPLTFVAGFFGMNLDGIGGSASQFWRIAGPMTGGILILCVVVAFKGEDIFFAIASTPRRVGKLFLKKVKEKQV